MADKILKKQDDLYCAKVTPLFVGDWRLRACGVMLVHYKKWMNQLGTGWIVERRWCGPYPQCLERPRMVTKLLLHVG